MKFLSEKLSKFTLHECIINELKTEESKIQLIFNNGIYLVNEGECTPTNECILELELPYFNIDEAFEHISIKLFHKKRVKEIGYSDLVRLLSKNDFKVYIDYYSELAQSVLLKGTIKNFEIEIIVTDIKDVRFIFHE